MLALQRGRRPCTLCHLDTCVLLNGDILKVILLELDTAHAVFLHYRVYMFLTTQPICGIPPINTDSSAGALRGISLQTAASSATVIIA